MVPDSASATLIMIFSMASTRSDSSRQSASASRSRAVSSSACRPNSATERSLVMGVRRSWATLSSDCCISITSRRFCLTNRLIWR
ncbi:MAG: hypothetical protein ACD_75C01454G0002 [uncultured bacterium]|nr:MAG: hypothetical protein ACD_75C01454G0002 [uncultured bacterium]